MFSELPVRAQQWRDFASAHSRGLRLKPLCSLSIASSLPQRIRAGCDCGKAMQRTANLLREGR